MHRFAKSQVPKPAQEHGLVDKVRINAKLLRQSPDAFQEKVKNYVRKRVNRLGGAVS